MSVLLPVWNGAAHLPTAIASLAAQRLEDFEVVVVDDGSTDDTPKLLARWARRDPRIRVLTAPRRGIARALQSALGEARAPLVARMDADDIALPHRLSAQCEALDSDHTISVLGTQVRLIPRGAITEGMLRYEAWLDSLTTPEEVFADLFVESPLVHPSIMARREALVAAGGYRDVDGPEDYDLWLRLAATGHKLANLPRTLLLWRDHPDRATRVDRRYRRQAIMRLKARHLLGFRLGGARQVGIWGAGPLGKAWARLLRRKGLDIRFFIDVSQKKIGQSIYQIPVLHPDDLPPPGALPLLAAVGAPGAREQIRAALQSLGYREPTHFVCVQ